MRSVLLTLGLANFTLANIIFTHVSLKCDLYGNKMYYGCLRGQYCDNNSTCQAIPENADFVYQHGRSVLPPKKAIIMPKELMRKDTYSADGTCGSTNGGTVCDPNSTVYTGSCCSSYGWCGNSDAHCGAGCQSGCTTTTNSAASPSSSTSPRADGQCGKTFGGATCDSNGAFGGCCSQYGYCGKTDGHCLISNGCQSGCSSGATSSVVTSLSLVSALPPNSAAPTAVTTGEPVIGAVTTTLNSVATSTAKSTTDGTCGSTNGGTVCGNWANGNCCSMYGFCGNTTSHCGAGCQSGDCTSTPAVTAPGASPAPAASVPGDFKVIGLSGVPAMHAALMPNGRVIFLDKLENYTQLVLPNGHYAMSSEYDPVNNTVVPLAYKTNAFCCGGTFLKDGRVLSVGGNAPLTWLDDTIADGFDAIRYLDRSSSDASLDGQDWSEPGNKLASARWYATAQTMPDGTIFVASGSLNGLDPTVVTNNNPTYEILSASGVSQGENIPLEILEKNQPYYMYPFVHLLNDGSLFIFTSKSSERFSVATNTTLQTYADLPGDYRTYPNTGGSVLLPLSSSNDWAPDVVICGGGAYQDITSPTDPSCGRIKPLATNPTWEMDSMPEGRGMVEGTLLPDGTVVWLNGGDTGAQGFGLMANPTFEALMYDPAAALGSRFSTLASSTIPRLYHSVALLLLDGTLMVAGSNPVEMPVLKADAQYPYATEFRVERYTPPYLQGEKADKRPTNVKLSTTTLAPAQVFTVSFAALTGNTEVSVVLYHGGFVTHSVHMGHRMLVCDSTGYVAGATTQTLTVSVPPNNNVLPPGPYVVYVLVDGVPAVGQFVSIS